MADKPMWMVRAILEHYERMDADTQRLCLCARFTGPADAD